MHEQLSLPGIPKPLEPIHGLFLGIFFDLGIRAELARFTRNSRATHGLQSKPFTPDRFHISLYSLGVYSELPASIVQAASMASERVAATMLPFWVTFDSAVSFNGKRANQPFVLRNNGNNRALFEFHRRLGAELRKCGVRCGVNSRFTPHITLLYAKQSVTEQFIEPVSWLISEFVLVHSLRSKSCYIPRGRWTLSS